MRHWGEPPAGGGVRAGVLIRFLADRPDPDSGRVWGVFQAAYAELRGDRPERWVRTELRASLDWFNAELARPGRFGRATGTPREPRGVCWFRPSARRHVREARYLGWLLGECGVPVRTVRTRKPGVVVYEDAAQIVAEPFAETPR